MTREPSELAVDVQRSTGGPACVCSPRRREILFTYCSVTTRLWLDVMVNNGCAVVWVSNKLLLSNTNAGRQTYSWVVCTTPQESVSQNPHPRQTLAYHGDLPELSRLQARSYRKLPVRAGESGSVLTLIDNPLTTEPRDFLLSLSCADRVISELTMLHWDHGLIVRSQMCGVLGVYLNFQTNQCIPGMNTQGRRGWHERVAIDADPVDPVDS